MLEDSIRSWNPWWADKQVPPELVGTQRHQLSELLEVLELDHIKDVVGVRRCGKTTLLHQLIQHAVDQGLPPEAAALLNFDDPTIHEAPFDELIDTLQTLQPDTRYLLLDEIQEREGWERWVRTLYDTGAFDQILVTGSSSSLLEGSLARVLSGRHVTIRMFPFSFAEHLAHTGWGSFDPDVLAGRKGQVLHHLKTYLEQGGFPEVIGRDQPLRKRILTTLFQDIVARDVVGRQGADPQLAGKLANVLLSNSGSPFTFRRLANATGMATDTVSKYTGYLEEAFLFLELPPYSAKVQERYRGPRKFYAIDPGLVHTVASRSSPDRGWAIENAVVLELLRRGAEIHHWRDDDQREVDVVVEQGTDVAEVIQIAYRLDTPGTQERELRALASAAERLEPKRARIVTWDEAGSLEVEGLEVEVVPLWRFLLDPPTPHP